MTSEEKLKWVYPNARSCSHGIWKDRFIIVIPPVNFHVDPHWGRHLTTKHHARESWAWADAWRNIQAQQSAGGDNK